MSDPYSQYPADFFRRQNESPDAFFYGPPRLVTHIDDAAIAEVGRLYTELAIKGQVLDLMSSWISHFETAPAELTVLGMNRDELDANDDASAAAVSDLNEDPVLPFADASFDAAVCCVSADYLTRPFEVFAEVGRVLRPGGLFVNTFSNRCFPEKAILGWLMSDDGAHCELVAEYYRHAGCFAEPTVEHRNADKPGDPLYAVWAARTP